MTPATSARPASSHGDAGLPGDAEPADRPARTAQVRDELAAKAAAENFPVALRLLPRRYRGHLAAVYAFARTTDDAGDEGPAAGRMGRLAALEADLRRLYAGSDDGAAAEDRAAEDRAAQNRAAEDRAAARLPAGSGARLPAIRALGPTVAECGIPMQPFLDLIRANQQDQAVSRYQTFDDLLGYCQLSANPVGRIVLYIFGSHSAARAELSDSVCTALQLAEHWQDVAEDYRAGRIYLPGQDMEEHGCTEQDLAAETAGPRLRALLRFETDRARALLDAGAPLIGTLGGAGRAAVAGYVAGGRAALAAIAAADYDVLAATPRPAKLRVAAGLALAYARGR